MMASGPDPVGRDEQAAAQPSAEGAQGGLQAGGQGAGPAAEASAAATRDLEQELKVARAKADENYDLFVRAKAETDNVRRRAQDDIAKAHKFAIESFAEALVPVADSLEKALELNVDAPGMRNGIELTLRQLRAAFEKNRLVEINPVGERFDPHRHQAISMVPAGAEPGAAPANHVVSVLQKGWMIADRVLRPALVTVAQGQGT